MSDKPEIIRIIQIGEQVVHVHIVLTDSEIARIASQVSLQMARQYRRQLSTSLVDRTSLLEKDA
jgi:hypothetical protein